VRRPYASPQALVALVVLAALLVGCGHIASSARGNVTRTTAPTHSEEWQLTRRVELPSHRAYALAAPDDAATAKRPIPLVIGLHGLYQLPQSFASETRLTSYGRAHGFAVAYGEGIKAEWNAGSCCRGDEADDMQYLVDVVADVSRRLPIDRRRVYVVGFSNGGMMALRAVCERPDLFAAAGVMSGALTVHCAATPPRLTLPVRVRQFDGAQDETVPPDGSRSSPLAQSFLPLDAVAAHLPAGSTFEATLVPGLSHHWAKPDNSPVDATDEFWQFLQRYTR
jgi:poly(3-hydroxybutyrate) depolymerase